jgi:hypothetical protein
MMAPLYKTVSYAALSIYVAALLYYSILSACVLHCRVCYGVQCLDWLLRDWHQAWRDLADACLCVTWLNAPEVLGLKGYAHCLPFCGLITQRQLLTLVHIAVSPAVTRGVFGGPPAMAVSHQIDRLQVGLAVQYFIPELMQRWTSLL